MRGWCAYPSRTGSWSTIPSRRVRLPGGPRDGFLSWEWSRSLRPPAQSIWSRSSNRYFKDTVAVRLDPAGLRYYEAARSAPGDEQRPRLVFFGDSRALMWVSPKDLAEYNVVNRGIGNQTTAQVLLRLDADLAPLRPRVVVLEVGVNDLKAVAQFPERRDQILVDCEHNIDFMVHRIRSMGATVVLVGVFGIGDVALWRRPFWSDDVITVVRQANAHLRSLAADGVLFLDPDPVLDDGRGRIKREYQLDFIHLDDAAYAALNVRLVRMVRALPR